MNKKLLTAISKFAHKNKDIPILRTTHTVATNDEIIYESTNSSILIRHVEKNLESLNFDILQSIDGNYFDPNKYPNVSRLFSDEGNSNILKPDKLLEFIVLTKSNSTIKNESFEIVFNEITYKVSTKFSKIIIDTLILFKNCDIKVKTTSAYKPIHFVITTNNSTTEILLSPMRK